MATKTFKVALSLDNPRIIQSGINVRSFDKQSIKIAIELTKNSQVYQIPTGAQIKISLLKLARQEQKIILDVPFTSADSIDWVVPDYLDGYQGEVRVGVYLIVGAENIDVGYFNITSSVSDIDSAAEEFTESVLQGWAIEDLTALLPKFQEVIDETTGKDVISAPEIILARGEFDSLGERLDREKAEVTSQLAQKADKSELENVKSGFLGDFNSEIELQNKYPDGETGYAVVYLDENGLKVGYSYTYKNGIWVKGNVWNGVAIADDSIGTNKYKNKSVTATKTSFMLDSKNLFNRKLLVKDYVWLNDARVGTPNANYSYLPDIEISSGQSITLNDSTGLLIDMRYVTAFDSAGNLLKDAGGQYLEGVYTAGAGVAKVVISILNTYLPRVLMLSYGSTPKAYSPYQITFEDDVVLSENQKNEVTNKLITTKFIQDSLTNFVNQIEDYQKIESKYISGYKPSGDRGPDLLNSNDTDVYKINYPEKRKGKLRVYFRKVPLGQQVFLTDKDDRYITMSNINNFPNWQRKGWTINQLENYFEIDLEVVDSQERYVYVAVLKSDAVIMYAGVDGKTHLQEIILDSTDLDILLPSKYPIVAGDTGYIYYDQTIYGNAEKSSYLNVKAWSNGSNRSSNNTVLANMQADATRMIKLEDNNTIISKSTSIKVVPKSAGEGTTKKLMVIGESTTDTAKSTFYIPALKGKFENDGMNIELVGTRGEAGFKHEGRSGWGVGALRYLASRIEGNVDNPFYNPVKDDFDFAHYCTSNPSASNLDIVIIRFGINEPNRFVENKTNATFIEHYNYIINDIKKTSPSCRFILDVTMSLARFPSAFPSANRETIMQRNKALIDEFDNRESESIYVSCSYLNVDPIYDYPLVEEPVNIYSTIKQLETTDNTHPAEPGQRKQADVTYWMIKYIASK